MTPSRLRALLVLLSGTAVATTLWLLRAGEWQMALVLYLLAVAVLGLLVAGSARIQRGRDASSAQPVKPAWRRGELAQCPQKKE